MRSLARLRPLVGVVFASLALSACASLNVNSYVLSGVEFRQYRTYDWEPADRLSTGDPRLDNNPFFDQRVRADVEQQLAARGFEKTTAGTPDLLVHYHASITQQIDTNTIDRRYGSHDEADSRAYVHDAGTILIDFIDPRTDKLLWRGWAEGSMDRVIDSQEQMEKDIDEAVEQILKRLPPRL